jgi:dTDP-4-amino-4,6-dideoxygalactose transaminase
MSILSDEDIHQINELLKKDISGWFKSHDGGPYLQEFQKKFAEFLGAKYAFAVSSGSASIYVALKAVGVGENDFVAVPAYTHIGSVAPILLAGAKPLFIDVNKYGNMDPEDLRKVASVMKVKAVIVVHHLGMPCDMDEIKEASENAFIIEDASHALGAEYKGKKAGVLGDIGCFSIGGGRTKTIGTGEGGMIVVNDGDLAEKCKNIRNHGDRVTDCDYLCFNFRMSELNALVGLLQMKKLQFLIDWQVKNAEYLIENLPEYLEVPKPPPYVKTVHYIIGCHFSTEKARMSRDDFLNKVKEKGYEGGLPRKNVGKGYEKLVSDVKFYTRFRRALPMSEYFVRNTIWIDWHRYPRTKDEIDELLKVFKEICQ